MISGTFSNYALQLNCIVAPHAMGPYDYAVFRKENGKKAIYYNKALSIEDAKVVSAKALVHHKHNPLEKEFGINVNTVLPEKEMSEVYEILIPQKTVNSLLEQLIAPSLESISNLFGVSQELMTKRLNFLEYDKPLTGYNC